MIQHNSRMDADGPGFNADIGQKSAKAYLNANTTVNHQTETPLPMTSEKWDDDTMHDVVTDTEMIEYTSTADADQTFPDRDVGTGWLYFIMGGAQLTNIAPNRCYVATQLDFPSTSGFSGCAWEAGDHFFRGTFGFFIFGNNDPAIQRHLAAYQESGAPTTASRKMFALFAMRFV